jgi:hypothetical protein
MNPHVIEKRFFMRFVIMLFTLFVIAAAGSARS